MKLPILISLKFISQLKLSRKQSKKVNKMTIEKKLWLGEHEQSVKEKDRKSLDTVSTINSYLGSGKTIFQDADDNEMW